MQEIGVDISRHKPKTSDDLQDTSFDVIVSLSPPAQHSAVELTRTMACDLIFWHTIDATAVRGNRETILDAYRHARDSILGRIDEQFAPPALVQGRETP